MQIQMDEIVGDRLQGLDTKVFKVRVRNIESLSTNRDRS
jgi:hypothetical protein